MEKKRRKAYFILNRYNDLWSQMGFYSKAGAEERIREACQMYSLNEEDFKVVEGSIVFPYLHSNS